MDRALSKQGIVTKAVERWKEEMPVEQEMVPKDKYTIFDRKEKKYRKSIRSEFLRIGSSEGRREADDLQSCQSGRGYHNESILLGTDRMYRVLEGCTILPRSIKGRRSGWDVYHKEDQWHRRPEYRRVGIDQFISQIHTHSLEINAPLPYAMNTVKTAESIYPCRTPLPPSVSQLE